MAGGRTLFFFVSPTCEPCRALVPDIAKWKTEFAGRVNFVFISSGDAAENRKKFGDFGDDSIYLDADRKFALAVGGRWTPTALLVEQNGKIASHVAAGDVAVEELIEKMRNADWDSPFLYFSNGNHHGRGLKIGASAPEFALKDVDGRDFRRSDLIGKRTLVTFWSPDCPHCRNFLDDFRKWTRSRSNGDPDVVLISEGDLDEHRNLDLGAPVVIDSGYKTAARLGMFGTPSAVLVDENGVIVTETAVGASNIWALLGRNNETN
jgi:thiol-disulfide isomerase/thioredoxin